LSFFLSLPRVVANTFHCAQDKTPLDKPMGYGWEYEVEMSAPPASAYCGCEYRLQVRFDHEWPDSPPFIRFKNVIAHSQCVHDVPCGLPVCRLSDVGVPIPEFYAELPENSFAHVSEDLAWPVGAWLLHWVCVCAGFGRLFCELMRCCESRCHKHIHVNTFVCIVF
jgi:hypothetical protein